MNTFLTAAAICVLIFNGGIPVLFAAFPRCAFWTWMACLALIALSARSLSKGAIWWGLFISAIQLAVSGAAQLTWAWPILREMGLSDPVMNGDRAFAWFVDAPALLGSFFAIVLPVLWLCAPKRWLGIAGLLICIAGLLMAGGKAAMLGAAVAGFIGARTFQSAKCRGAVSALLIAVVAASLTIRHVGVGFIRTRIDYWKAAVAMIADHPFAGIGVGQFGETFATYRPVGHHSPFAHNDILQISAECGAVPIGVLFLAAIVFVLWRGAMRRAAAPYLAGFAAFVVCGLFNFVVYIPALSGPAALFAGFILGGGQEPSSTNPAFFAVERSAA